MHELLIRSSIQSQGIVHIQGEQAVGPAPSPPVSQSAHSWAVRASQIFQHSADFNHENIGHFSMDIS